MTAPYELNWERCTRLFVLIILVQGLLAAGLFGDEDPLDSWTWQRPLPQGADLWSVTWTGEHFFAVGNVGTLMRSRDGWHWEVLAPISREERWPGGVREQFRKIVWTGTELITAGAKGTVLRSLDGLAWEDISLPQEARVETIAASDERIVVGGYDYVQRSGALFHAGKDGEWMRVSHWRILKSYIRDVVWNGEIFLALGTFRDGQDIVARSPDGIAWVVDPAPEFGWLEHVVWTGDEFIASGRGSSGSGSPILASSEDGIEWKRESFPGTIWARQLIRAGERIATLIPNGPTLATLGKTEDGWDVRSERIPGEIFTDVAWDGGKLVAVGFHGAIFVSEDDGQSWAPLGDRGKKDTLWSIAWGNGRFVIARSFRERDGSGDKALALVSVDGRRWVRRELPQSQTLWNVISNGTTFFSWSWNRPINTSADGFFWESTTLDPVDYLTTQGDRLLAIQGDRILASDDLRTWTEVGPAEVPGKIKSVAGNEERIVAAGKNFIMVREADDWKTRALELGEGVSRIGFHEDKILVVFEVQEGIEAALSTDGQTWTTHPVTKEGDLSPRHVQRIDGRWVVPTIRRHETGWGNDWALYVSDNGQDWEVKVPPVDHSIYLASSDRTVVMTGGFTGAGYILTSHTDTTTNRGHQILTSSPFGGHVEVSPRDSLYEDGAEVQVTAVPDPGYEFVEWVGDLDGSDPSHLMTMDTHKIVSARFRLEGANERYQEWARQFPENDAALVGPFADYNNDGITNLLKYAFWLDPFDPSSRPRHEFATSTWSGGYRYAPVVYSGWVYRAFILYDRDLLYTIEYSDDLVTWSGMSFQPPPVGYSLPVHLHGERISLEINNWAGVEAAPKEGNSLADLPPFFRTRVSFAGD